MKEITWEVYSKIFKMPITILILFYEMNWLVKECQGP